MPTPSTQHSTSLGLLILRIGVSGFMVTHGWGKFQMVLAGDFDKFADPLGIGTTLSLIMVAFAEFFCAILVVIGAATRLACIPIIFAMAVAAFIVHGSDPWTMGEAAKQFMAGASKSWGSKEPALLFLAVYLALVFTGAGRFSIDALVWPMIRGRKTKAAA